MYTQKLGAGLPWCFSGQEFALKFKGHLVWEDPMYHGATKPVGQNY